MQRREQSILERAFELARSGEHTTVQTIRHQLRAEKYEQVDAHLTGSSVSAQLKGLMAAAKRS